MALSFNHTTRFITVPQVDAGPLQMQTLINAIRAEEASERGMVNDQVADATGKNDLGSGVQTGITVALRSSWKLDFQAGAYQATISGGNLADALSRVNNTGSPQVLVQSSAAATLVLGSGGAAPTAAQNADAVWTRVLEAGLTAEQLQRLIVAVLAGEVTGAGTDTERFRDLADTKDRIVATVDNSGNRSMVVRDAT